MEGLRLDSEPLTVGDFEIWPAEDQVFLRGDRLRLTRQEFEVLEVLAAAPDRVISRDRIHEHVWHKPLTHPHDRSIDVVIRRIRMKLREVAPGADYIITHHGLGYRLDPVARVR